MEPCVGRRPNEGAAGGDLCVRRGRPAEAGAEANADRWRRRAAVFFFLRKTGRRLTLRHRRLSPCLFSSSACRHGRAEAGGMGRGVVVLSEHEQHITQIKGI